MGRPSNRYLTDELVHFFKKILRLNANTQWKCDCVMQTINIQSSAEESYFFHLIYIKSYRSFFCDWWVCKVANVRLWITKGESKKSKICLHYLFHNKSHGLYIFMLNEVFICIFIFAKTGPKMSSNTILCPHCCLKMWYTIPTIVTKHIYILLNI